MPSISRSMPSVLILLTLSVFPLAVFAAEDTNASSEDKKQSTREPSLANQVEQTIGRLESIRQLKAKSGINAATKTRKQLRQYLEEQIDKNFEPGLIEAEGRLFELLGLIPPDFKYRQSILELLTQQIAGFYDPKSQKLYLLEKIPTTFHSHALAHEIFHAIQDQHFNIDSLSNPIPKKHQNQDLTLARQALLEGDAMVVTFDHFLHDSGMLPFKNKGQTYRTITDIPQFRQSIKKRLRPSAKPILQMNRKPGAGSPFGALSGQFPGRNTLSDVPTVIRRPLLFPYLKGLRFVLSQKEPGDWESLNQLYRVPPDSTEQIMHPEKYVEQDVPTSIFFDPFENEQKAGMYANQYENVLGEFMIKTVLESYDDEEAEAVPSPAEAAKGWDGDRLILHKYTKSPNTHLISHASVWDSRRDAEQFYRAMRYALKTRFGLDMPHDRKGKTCFTASTEPRVHSICLQHYRGRVIFTDLTAPESRTKKVKRLHTNTRKSIWTEPFHRTIRRLNAQAKEKSDRKHRKRRDSE